MPKNQFQRPLPVRHTHNVPRHGAPIVQRKPEARRSQPAKEAAPLPALEDLLKRNPRT